jgi:hypothetical protein
MDEAQPQELTDATLNSIQCSVSKPMANLALIDCEGLSATKFRAFARKMPLGRICAHEAPTYQLTAVLIDCSALPEQLRILLGRKWQ